MRPPNPRTATGARLIHEVEERIRQREREVRSSGRDGFVQRAMPADYTMALVYLKAHPRSVELIRYNAGRGMSRQTMNGIWGRRLVDIVLDNVEV